MKSAIEFGCSALFFSHSHGRQRCHFPAVVICEKRMATDGIFSFASHLTLSAEAISFVFSQFSWDSLCPFQAFVTSTFGSFHTEELSSECGTCCIQRESRDTVRQLKEVSHRVEETDSQIVFDSRILPESLEQSDTILLTVRSGGGTKWI
jgi:hypothetical protein